MDTVVVPQIDRGDGGLGHRSDGLVDNAPRAAQRQDRAVVVRIRMEIQQTRAGCTAEAGEDLGVTPLTDVDDAFEQVHPLRSHPERFPGTNMVRALGCKAPAPPATTVRRDKE
jgi:hypothetical protein